MSTLVLIRRVEVLVLLVLTAGLVVTGLGVVPLDILLLTAAVVLVCCRVKTEQSQQSIQEIQTLLEDGLRLYLTYGAARKLRSSWQKTKDIALIRYETEKWTDRAKVLLRSYPEFVGIFEADRCRTPVDELASRLRRLGEIKRLVEKSQRTGLRRA